MAMKTHRDIARFGTAVIILLLAVLTPVDAHAQDLADVFARVSEAVVVVYTQTTDYAFVGEAVAVSVPGTGSGVVISATQIMTAAHVVQSANQVVVVFPNGDEIPAIVRASSESHDVALLDLTRPTTVTPATLGDSDAVRVGEEVFVIGAPLGEGHTLTVGHLSARRQRAGLLGTSSVEFMQTDAAINPGNSGGPLFNMQGEVIGIVSHILTMSGGSQGLGYAVASNTAEEVLLNEASWWSGLSGTPITGMLANLLNVPEPHAGLMVAAVAAGSFAEDLGVRPGIIPVTIGGQEFKLGGDIILSVQGRSLGPNLQNADVIREELLDLPRGSTLRVTVLRAGELLELSARTR